MSFWRQLVYGLRSLIYKGERDRDVSDEVEQYLDEATAAWMERGLTAEEAERAARLEAGNITAAREQVRSYGWENSLAAFWSDLRFAVRQLHRHLIFTMTAVLTLALGIGANTAIFTVVESVLLRPLPYPDAKNISVLDTHWTNSGHTSSRVTGPDGADVRDQARSFAAVSLYNGGNEGVELRDHSAYTVVTWADANFARVFGLEPIAGRLFTDGETHRAAVVSEEFARDNFGSAQAALGQMVHVEGEPIEITGVLPKWFDFPSHTQVWEAAPINPESKSRTAFNYKAVTRLRPGVNVQAAQSELDGISRRLERAYPDANRDKRVLLQPLQEALTGDARPTLSASLGNSRFNSADRMCERDASATRALDGASAGNRDSQGARFIALAGDTAGDP